MADKRLIETWLPIAALGEESVRERRFSMQGNALPPNNSLHVWWARRPLVASRAALLASVLPEDADHERFLRALGIHGDPVATKRRLALAKKTGENLGSNPYGYERAFRYSPSAADQIWLKSKIGEVRSVQVLDATAGGGSIPFEAIRLGLAVHANDLNPVAGTILHATLSFPAKFGRGVCEELRQVATAFSNRAETRYHGVFPTEEPGTQVLGYLWSRTITCPYCDGLVPLSPNWQLGTSGTGVRVRPLVAGGPGTPGRSCKFEIVHKAAEHSVGTVSGGTAACPFPDCERVIEGETVKAQAQAGSMGEQLFAVAFKRRSEKQTRTGKRREVWERGYRAPRPEDDNGAAIAARLTEKMPEWEALDIVPVEAIPEGHKTDEPLRYGMKQWTDIFSPRQLLCHALGVEIFREMLAEDETGGLLTELRKAAYIYLALGLDRFRDYNSRMTRWHSTREVVVNTFDRHDFAFKWSYAEMAPLITGRGFQWAIEQTANCVEGLVRLVCPAANQPDDLYSAAISTATPPPIAVTCKSAEALDHLTDASLDVVVMDPPYYDNVMYAELSDFFYVWLKRTAGHVLPDLFTRTLTDKESEAVANPAKFDGQKGAKALAGRDYQERMQAIFTECRRVLKPDGIMTVMFTHKATGAWDALTLGLMQAGFQISASWPVNTEAETSLHIKDKSAANSTIFLVCRPQGTFKASDTTYWEDVEPLVAKAVRARVQEFQKAGISGVDLYLACFGPALEEFSRHWPLQRGTPRPVPESRKRRRQAEMFDEVFDPFAVTPEDALNAARQEVKRWRLEQLTQVKASFELDPVTSWFVLAWDAFQAPAFPFDEALRLAQAVGVNLDREVVGRLAEKKGSDLILWDSARRAAKGALGPADGSRGMIDALHHAAHLGRTRTLEAAHELLQRNALAAGDAFLTALRAVLEVLPVPKAFTGIDLEGEAAASAGDFEALEKLRRLAFAGQVPEPKQLDLWKDERTAA